MAIPTDAQERKNAPIYSGVLKYFPDAIVAVAQLSKKGNDQQNPGQPHCTDAVYVDIPITHWRPSKEQ